MRTIAEYLTGQTLLNNTFILTQQLMLMHVSEIQFRLIAPSPLFSFLVSLLKTEYKR